jgi:hypothetical protein
MTSQNKCECGKQRTEGLNRRDPQEMMDALLALDRMLVEVSMRLYNVPRRDRFTLRKHNRRLHAAVRQQLPRLLMPSRSRT